VDRIERPVTPGAVSGIGGFIGTRLRANVDGYLKVFDVDHYVRLVEQKQYRDWKWVGEHPGKWLESAALAAEQTGDDMLRAKAGKILARLVAAQEPGGYLGVTDPAVRTDELPLRGMDAYELYFMLHGMLTAYDFWGEDSAQQAAERLGDYFVEKIGPGKAEFWPLPKGQTIAGHNIHYSLEGTLLVDPMLRLYQATGDRKYLEWSRWVIENIDRWSGHNTFSKLDKVANGTLGVHELQPRVHAHTLHMNLLGFLRLYQITGDETLLGKVRGAWRDIAGRQMYVTGGVSVGEYYRPGNDLPITGEVVETCAMMSWIELSQYLLELTADPVYADAIEKLLWNHLFAAQTVDGDVFRYHTPLNGTKPAGYFHGPDCCTASGPRIAAKIPLLIYAAGGDVLYVNQFIESKAEIELDSGNIVTLSQETDFPAGDKIIIRVEPQKEQQFSLNVRLPAWCPEPSLCVNGQEVSDLKSGTYAKLDRLWKKSDRVMLSLPMTIEWIKRSRATEDLWALKRGPVVYAVDTVWWNEQVAGELGSVPEDLSKVIKVVIEQPGQAAGLEPVGVLGPSYPVAIILPNGKRADVKALPFANVGRWYSEAANKSDRDERRYSYAVWLPGVKNVPAFPGAEGAGAGTPGGRGGKVFEVTNLNDDGSGSLREAVEARGPRIVVFRVSGIIKLDKVLAISNPFITIAGQTAPGEGICISGQTTEINTHDVVLRYLRFRRGNIKDRNDSLGGYPVGNIIIDHCSASWGLDENISLYRYMKKMPDGSLEKTPAENITIQWCISSEALDLNNHAFGGTWGGKNCSFHHNLFACNTGRNPSIGWGDHFDFRNNVLFNWRHRTVDGGDASSMVNIVANYYKPGPAVDGGASRYLICRPQHLDMYSEAKRDGKWYVADNFVVGSPGVTADNWAGGVQFDDVDSENQVKALIEKVRSRTPIPSVPITQQSAEEAYELVLAEAGATLPKRDAVDARIIESVRTGQPLFGNGIIDMPSDVCGWPEYKSSPAPTDTDHDGMPDEWEERFGLNPDDPSDGAGDKDGDGYTNVEEWLNGMDPAPSETVYMFSSFRDNGQDGLHLAYSFDGYKWTDLGGSFLKPQVGIHKLMRDPSVVRGPDGTFHIVWTTGWRDDKGFGYARSRDLIYFSEQKFVEAMAHEPDTFNVWAPELFYDEGNKQFIICWASTISGRYPAYLEDPNSNHRIYYTTTRDFETFTETKLFFEPGFSVIDAVIVKWDSRYVLVHKDNTRPLLNLRAAFGDGVLGPFTDVSKPFTEKFTEGPSVLRLGNEWIVYFDMYQKKQYGAVKTHDFKTWTDVTNLVSFPAGHKHGTVFVAPISVLNGLKQHRQRMEQKIPK